MRAEKVIHNATLIDPVAGTQTRGGVLVRDGLIAAVGPDVMAKSAPAGAEIIDAKVLMLAPGLIDLMAFCGEPGAEHRETLRTASEAAAAGGVTTVVCRPDTEPMIDEPSVIDFIKRRARDKAIVNILPAAAMTRGMQGKEMTEFGMMLDAGAIAFTDAPNGVANAQMMARALTYAKDVGALIMAHVEDHHLGTGVMNRGEFASRLGLPGTPREAEIIRLERDLRLVRMTGGRYHAAKISTTDSVELIRKAKADGLAVTCGIAIHTLTLNENDVGNYRTFCKVSPPLRTEDERLALIQAVADGVIDAIVSDHDPQDVETKRLPFAEAANGALGLETMLSAALRLVHDGRITLPRLIAAMTLGPAAILGLPAGRLAVGAPADLVLFDPDEPWVCAKDKLKSRAKNSPFDEARMTGRATMTVVAGQIVWRG